MRLVTGATVSSADSFAAGNGHSQTNIDMMADFMGNGGGHHRHIDETHKIKVSEFRNKKHARTR